MPYALACHANDTNTFRTWLMIISVAAFMPLVWSRCCGPLAGGEAGVVGGGGVVDAGERMDGRKEGSKEGRKEKEAEEGRRRRTR